MNGLHFVGLCRLRALLRPAPPPALLAARSRPAQGWPGVRSCGLASGANRLPRKRGGLILRSDTRLQDSHGQAPLVTGVPVLLRLRLHVRVHRSLAFGSSRLAPTSPSGALESAPSDPGWRSPASTSAAPDVPDLQDHAELPRPGVPSCQSSRACSATWESSDQLRHERAPLRWELPAARLAAPCAARPRCSPRARGSPRAGLEFAPVDWPQALTAC